MIRLVLWTVTFSRIALLPVFLAWALRAERLAEAGLDTGGLRWTAVGVLLAIGVSDILDGWIARRYDLASQMGAVVDALADKLAQLVVATFFALAAGSFFAPLPLWFLALLVGRDLLLGGSWVTLRARGHHIRVVHRAHGRASSVAVFVVLAWLTVGASPAGLSLLLWATGALIVASTASYVWDGLTRLREASAPPGHQ